MAAVLVQELLEKVNALSETDRAEFLRRLNEPVRKEAKPNGTKTNGQMQGKQKGYVSPDTIWMRDHSAPYAGKYVALENGELVATGKGYPDTLANARKAGAKRPMITYVPRKDEKLFAGW